MANNQPQPQKSNAELIAENAALRAKLDSAEAQALASALSTPIIGGTADEVPTGRTITMTRCTNPWERNERKQKFEEVEVPTYHYAIQLPAGAGVCLTTNGVEYHHGQVYEVDYHTLVDLKSRVARTWDHEKSIHGDNENAFRKPANNALISAAAAARARARH